MPSPNSLVSSRQVTPTSKLERAASASTPDPLVGLHTNDHAPFVPRPIWQPYAGFHSSWSRVDEETDGVMRCRIRRWPGSVRTTAPANGLLARWSRPATSSAAQRVPGGGACGSPANPVCATRRSYDTLYARVSRLLPCRGRRSVLSGGHAVDLQHRASLRVQRLIAYLEEEDHFEFVCCPGLLLVGALPPARACGTAVRALHL